MSSTAAYYSEPRYSHKPAVTENKANRSDSGRKDHVFCAVAAQETWPFTALHTPILKSGSEVSKIQEVEAKIKGGGK